MNFRVGMKVVCIYGGDWQIHGHETVPRFQKVYTIRAIDPRTISGCALLLAEIKNRPDIYRSANGVTIAEKCWRGSRFRPVVERKTDISIFTAMLNPSKRSVDA